MGELELVISGFTIVVAVLCFLWLACAFVGWFHKDRAGSMKPVEIPTDSVPAPIPNAHLAVISAAIAAMVPGKHRIVRVYAPAHKAYGWTEEGRYELLTSHRVRWDWAAPGPEKSPNTKKQSNNIGIEP